MPSDAVKQLIKQSSCEQGGPHLDLFMEMFNQLPKGVNAPVSLVMEGETSEKTVELLRQCDTERPGDLKFIFSRSGRFIDVLR